MALLSIGASCAALGDETSQDGEDGEQYDPFVPDEKADQLSVGTPLSFEAACEPGDRLLIGAVGDVLLHGSLQKQAFREDDGFTSLWRDAVDLLGAADISYANLEGPTAAGVKANGRETTDPGKVFDDVVYTSYPQFNYHPSLVDDLKSSGIDVLSTANNHSLDRRALGIDRTVDALRERGMPFSGTRKRGETNDWHTITKAKGFTIAWLACTYATNGIPDTDDQVLSCFNNPTEVSDIVSSLSAQADIDAVIVTPHWGEEYKANPNARQMEYAHKWLDAGATAILGSHPHVLEPWEKYRTADGRETFIIYSLGNFVSGQRQLARRSTLMTYLSLVRSDVDGKVKVSGARHVPLHMSKDSSAHWDLEVVDRNGQLGDSRELTLSMFSLLNIQWPWETPVANLECEESYTTPHPHDGWIGGRCAGTEACGDAACDTETLGGMCTMSCTGSCPDSVGRATTMCGDLSGEGAGLCFNRCTSAAECPEGYSCQPTNRFGQPGVTIDACVPTQAP